MTRRTQNRIERRRQSDPWLYLLRAFTIIGWLLFVVAVVMSYYAGPERVMGIMKYKIVDARDDWLFPLTDYLFYLLVANACLSIFTIVINRYRSRRSTDVPGFNNLLLLIVCSLWLLYLFYVVKV